MTETIPDHILDDYRDINVDDNHWYKELEDDFTDDMLEIGVRVDAVYFSGFYSQGDGASFEGYVTDPHKLLTAMGYDCPSLKAYVDLAGFHNVHFYCRGRYCHECTMYIGSEDGVFAPMPGDEFFDESIFRRLMSDEHGDSLRVEVMLSVLRQYDAVKLEAEMLGFARDKARDLYRQLSELYDYLTSDEQVAQALIDNNVLTQEFENG